MTAIEFEGDTLGQKHRNYNNLVKAATANDDYKLSKLNYNESDINNMLRIDVACNRRMVEYILEVFQCQDMLYVSRAIKDSVWLIAEEQYVNIINPEYLNDELFPNMMIKAKRKLLASIQKNLKDSTRVEAFFNYYKKDFPVAQNWLRHCSTDFVLDIVATYGYVTTITFNNIKHLCRKSPKILNCYLNNDSRDSRVFYRYLLQAEHDEAKEILEFVYSGKYYNRDPNFRKRFTRSLMKRYPDIIIENIDKYYYGIDLATFVKYLKKEDIEDILSTHIQSDFMKQYKNFKHFLRYMPETKRLYFIQNILTQKENALNSISESSLADIKGVLGYKCYEFLPFDKAFIELQNIIAGSSSPYKRNSILSVLVSSAREDSQHIQTLLEYYQTKHKDDSYEDKVQFLNKLLIPKTLKKFNERVWSIIDDIFTSMDIYTDTNKDVPKCFEVMIVYKLIHDKQIPETIYTKVNFKSFLDFRSKLNAGEKRKVLSYVFESCFTKLYKKYVVDEKELRVMVDLITKALVLLKDWDKGPDDYPVVIAKIREIIKIKIDNCWDVDLSTLYKVNKSFMRQMHDELLLINPSDEICLNAFKHDTRLLSRYKDELIAKCCNGSISLKRTLKTIRFYWPKSAIQQWVEKFVEYLQQSVGSETIVRNLFILLPYEEVLPILIRIYALDETNSEHDNNVNRLRQIIARLLCLLRPSVVDEGDLKIYVKEEYFQYIIPKSTNEFWSIILILLRYGYLHKYAIRLAYSILQKNTFEGYHIMKFPLVMKLIALLCKNIDISTAVEVWDLFRKVYDDLLLSEKEKVASKFFKVAYKFGDDPTFFLKIYTFLKDTGINPKFDDFIVTSDALKVLDKLDPDFVENEMMVVISERIFKDGKNVLDEYGSTMLSRYLLNCDCENIQVKRYEKILIPIMKRAFASWELPYCDNSWCSPRCSKHTLYTVFDNLAEGLVRSITKFKYVVPVRVFTSIRDKLENVLNLEKDLYIIMTWNIYVIFLEILNVNLEMKENIFLDEYPELMEWDTVYLGFVNTIGQAWFKYFRNILKECTSFLVLVSKVCLDVFATFGFDEKFKLHFAKWLLTNNNEPLLYCIAIHILQHVGFDGAINEIQLNVYTKMFNELIEIIRDHPSVEVRWYYNNVYV